MHINDKCGMEGIYTIKAFDALSGELCGLWNYHNLLTKINQNIRTAMLVGTAAAAGYDMAMLQIKYFAFGDGSASATVNDTKLQNEIYRKPITQTTQTSESIVQTIVNLLATEANFHIREIGVFSGPEATREPDSGLLISRAIVSIEKNSNLVLNVVRQDVITV